MSCAGEDIVDEHLECVASHWRERTVVVRSRIHDLVDLLRLDDQLRANLDGVVAAGELGWELACHRAGSREPGRVFGMVAVAGLRGDRDGLEAAVAPMLQDDAQWPPMISALGWLPGPVVSPIIDDWLEYDGPRWRALGLAASVAQRRDPRGAVDRGLLDHDPYVLRHAVRAAEVFGRRTLIETLRTLRGGRGLRFVVARALLVLGDDDGAANLWSYALERKARAEPAAELAIRHVPLAAARRWIDAAARISAFDRLVVVGAAATGSPCMVPRLLAALHAPAVAALAGYGLQVMLGLDLDATGLAIEPLSTDDAELPYPDAAGVERWWHEHRARFNGDHRYLQGRRLRPSTLREALLEGPQHVRRVAAHDLYRLRVGHGLPFEVDAPAWRQRRWLG
ncbi:MAG: hypothetical protein AB1Z98_34205 [Nannocystaceae bacterium]